MSPIITAEIVASSLLMSRDSEFPELYLMKTIKSLLTLSAVFAALFLRASAGFYTDTDVQNVTLSEGDSVTGQWSYGPIGAGETITKIDTWFKFSSEDSETEQFHIDLGVGDGNIDASTTSLVFNFGSNYTLNWTFTNNASLFADAANGLLSYTVTATSNNNRQWENDFTFNWAKVEVTTAKSSVPDGATTIALLGMSFIGLVGMQRKFRLVR